MALICRSPLPQLVSEPVPVLLHSFLRVDSYCVPGS
jgi:hypothetical protein